MSAVYRARRADGQFDQTVAVKIMAGYLADREFLRRFETERQLLASLNHDHITRLLDGGLSSAGDPFLVTEYIQGQTIDRYCDQHKLDGKARLLLFLQVCEAVDHAHRNLIVHRDLKPGNILVNMEGSVKLLDFGTASLAAAGDVTLTRARMLTPRYASPEQLRGERVGIATDIFSLGVVLYELLTGAWPFGDPASMLSELNRVVGEARAQSPTAAITGEAAQCRSASPGQLRRLLRGDLSAILLKALEDDPARRYQSVRQFTSDLESFLAGRPVLARRLTFRYRAAKFLHRRWLSASAAAVFTLVLSAATIVALHQAHVARLEAARAQRIAEFAKNTFLSASSTWTSPLRGKSNAIQFSDILDNAVERIGKELGNDPEAEADMRGSLGTTYSILGDPVKGEAQLLLAIQRLKRATGGSPRLAGDLYVRLCDTLSFEGRYTEALRACQESLALARIHGSSLGISTVMHDTAYMTVKTGAPLENAEELYREALQAGLREGAPKLLSAIINTRIGDLRQRLGDLAGGADLLREAERVLRSEAGPPIEIIPVLSALAAGCRMRGDYGTATRYLNEAVDLLTGRPTPYLGRDQIEMELAAVESLSGDPQSLRRWQNAWGRLQATPLTAAERVHFEMISGIVEAHFGSPDSAERHLRAAIVMGEKELPRQPADRVEIYLRLAELLANSGRRQEAAVVAREGLRTAESAYGTFFAHHPLVEELRKQGA
jgi:serine/threonine protein kinase